MTLNILASLLCLTAMASPVLAEQEYPAKLAGHAIIPAFTLVPAPADAPKDAQVAGKFTGTARNMVPETVMGDTGAMHGKRPTGIKLPFKGQPVQGLSGFAMDKAADGSIYVLTDNGYGSKLNSPDALLYFYNMAPIFDDGTIAIKKTIFLRDPDFKVPFRIAYEGTDSRYLTGADFDIESIQVVGGDVWIGDEFGPYIIRTSLDGAVKAVYPTMDGDVVLKSADQVSISSTSVAGKDWTVQRSGGFEGMAAQPGTTLLWALLEKPTLGADGKPEGTFIRAHAFDTATEKWTGAQFKFQFAEGATSIGDFNFIDATRALVIERDNGEGDPSLKCEGDPKPDCFPLPAMVKRVSMIDSAQVDAEGFVKKLGYIDLMNIADPDNKNRQKTDAKRDLTGKFTFPFFTIEDVMRVDDTHILVGDDNNLPYSSGRKLDAAADNEMILLDVTDFLNAK